MDFLKKIKNKIVKSELELKLKESISEDPKINYLTLVEEISKKTEDKSELGVIIKFFNKKLNSHKWKRILKTLKLISFLLKSADHKFITELIYEKERIIVLTKFYQQVNGAKDSKLFIYNNLYSQRKSKKYNKTIRR